MIAALLLLITTAGPVASPQASEDPIGSKLFPPELIMSHQSELGIDDKQRAAIVAELDGAQPHILQAQWDLQAAAEQLSKLLEPGHIDEAKTLAQAEKVMNLERDVKKLHLGLLIRIRNLLNDAQRAKLFELRRAGSPTP
jgi:Spy/CpxP family protein refolding chaperone